MAAIPLEQEIEYPTSDGQPMAETTLHRKVMCDLIWGLEQRYAKVPDVWVGGNLFLCYEKGNPSAAIAPDVLLARGVTKWDRPNYLVWDEAPPSLIIEVTSLKTRREDQRKKRTVYERIGVEELMFFDPYGEYLRPRLQGYRLVEGRFRPIPPGSYGCVESCITGLKLRPERDRLRLLDIVTGEGLQWIDELSESYRRAIAEAARAQAEAAWLEAEERLRALERERE